MKKKMKKIHKKTNYLQHITYWMAWVGQSNFAS